MNNTEEFIMYCAEKLDVPLTAYILYEDVQTYMYRRFPELYNYF